MNLTLPKYIGRTHLTEKEMLFLDLTLIIPLHNRELFKMVYPENNGLSNYQLNNKVDAIVTSSDGETYLKERKRQIEEYYWPTKQELSEEEKEKRAEGFSANFADKVKTKLEAEIDNPSSPVYFDALKLAAQKVFKDMELSDIDVPPMRFLATSCGQCRYRLFCEDECEDECVRCKYRKYGEENGLKYDHKTMLEK